MCGVEGLEEILLVEIVTCYFLHGLFNQTLGLELVHADKIIETA